MMVLAGSRAPQADTATGGRGALPVQPHGLFHCFFRATPARVPSCLRRGSAVDNCFDASGTLRSRRGHRLVAAFSTTSRRAHARPRSRCSAPRASSRALRWRAGSSNARVGTALTDGTYEPQAPDPASIAKLKQAFPQGVCNYSRPRPSVPVTFAAVPPARETVICPAHSRRPCAIAG